MIPVARPWMSLESLSVDFSQLGVAKSPVSLKAPAERAIFETAFVTGSTTDIVVS
jgi:hypothetical protein